MSELSTFAVYCSGSVLVGVSVGYILHCITDIIIDVRQSQTALQNRITALENKCQELSAKPIMQLIVNKDDKKETDVISKETGGAVVIDS
jgi:hypothetical protein